MSMRMNLTKPDALKKNVLYSTSHHLQIFSAVSIPMPPEADVVDVNCILA